ncbi:hypothetical protein [Haladaptatus salinisoli]|uniref:hypothetical protein n=1 Tax=Haladaptatus salinisoli TaxID=2884876 RepID=UPI001D0A4928|nr:hypothetical protein [Haladaptatus salinisoli]
MPTDVSGWLAETARNARGDRRGALLKAGQTVYNGLWYTVSSRRPLGTNVFERAFVETDTRERLRDMGYR